jgi:hypothetical protein
MSSLSEAERRELEDAQKRGWPEYPVKIKHLADRYGLRPPWFSLPEPSDARHHWDKYRARKKTSTD